MPTLALRRSSTRGEWCHNAAQYLAPAPHIEQADFEWSSGFGGPILTVRRLPPPGDPDELRLHMGHAN
jgi:hypothetical protein